MFPDISLLCGTTVPQAVPSPAFKTSSAFEQTFSDLLSLVDVPVSTGGSTIESFIGAGPAALNDAHVETPPTAEPRQAASAPFLPAPDVPVYAEPLQIVRAGQGAPPMEIGATRNEADREEDEPGEDLVVLAAVVPVPLRPANVPDPEHLPALTLVKELDADPADASDRIEESDPIEGPRSPGVPIRMSQDLPVELRSVADVSTALTALATPDGSEAAVEPAAAPVLKATESSHEVPDAPHAIAALRRAAAQAQSIGTEPPRRTSIELPRRVSSELWRDLARIAHTDRPSAEAKVSESFPVTLGDSTEVPLAAENLEAIDVRGSVQGPLTSLAPTAATEQVGEQDFQAPMAGGKPSKSDAASSPVLQISVPVPKSPFSTVLNAASQMRPAPATLPNEAATAHSIVQTLRLQATNGGGTAVITLTPKYLGAVTVSLRVSEGGVTATLQAENPSVRSWIESNAPLLKDSLAERGLTLTEMVVAEPYEPRRQMEDQPRRHAGDRAPTRRSRRREESTFDVVV